MLICHMYFEGLNQANIWVHFENECFVGSARYEALRSLD